MEPEVIVGVVAAGVLCCMSSSLSSGFVIMNSGSEPEPEPEPEPGSGSGPEPEPEPESSSNEGNQIVDDLSDKSEEVAQQAITAQRNSDLEGTRELVRAAIDHEDKANDQITITESNLDDATEDLEDDPDNEELKKEVEKLEKNLKEQKEKLENIKKNKDIAIEANNRTREKVKEEAIKESMEAIKTWENTRGCTDPDAFNYNIDAGKDDGSCVYEKIFNFTNYFPSSTNPLKCLAMGRKVGDEFIDNMISFVEPSNPSYNCIDFMMLSDKSGKILDTTQDIKIINTRRKCVEIDDEYKLLKSVKCKNDSSESYRFIFDSDGELNINNPPDTNLSDKIVYDTGVLFTKDPTLPSNGVTASEVGQFTLKPEETKFE